MLKSTISLNDYLSHLLMLRIVLNIQNQPKFIQITFEILNKVFSPKIEIVLIVFFNKLPADSIKSFNITLKFTLKSSLNQTRSFFIRKIHLNTKSY